MGQLFIEFARVIAWPFVVTVAVVLLFPGGYLLKIIDKLSDNASKIAQAIKELRTAGEKLSSDIEKFSGLHSTMSNELRPSLDTFNCSMETMIWNLKNVEKSTTEILVNIGKMEISRQSDAVVNDDLQGDDIGGYQQADDIGGSQQADEVEAAEPDITVGQMYEVMIKKWATLSDLIREKIGPTFDGREVGRMAWRLAHGHRTNPIRRSDAELIESLHSQFKRFTRLKSTKDDWLSAEIYDTFIQGIEQAVVALNVLPAA